MLGALVGLKAEAKLLRMLLPDAPIAVSGATFEGARQAMDRLRQAGVTSLLSFGCSAGLSPDVRAGSVQVAAWVDVDGVTYETDPALRVRFGADLPEALGDGLCHSDTLVVTAAEKEALYKRSGCLAVDMESGLVAQSGLPFAVLRVVCDDARRDLPPVACDVLAGGRISVPRLIGGLARQPGQIGALIALGREAARAQQSMKAFLTHLAVPA